MHYFPLMLSAALGKKSKDDDEVEVDCMKW